MAVVASPCTLGPKPLALFPALLFALSFAVGLMLTLASPAASAPLRAPTVDNITSEFSTTDGAALRVSGSAGPGVNVEVYPQSGCSGQGRIITHGIAFIEKTPPKRSDLTGYFRPVGPPPFGGVTDASGKYSQKIAVLGVGGLALSTSGLSVPQFVSVRSLGSNGQHSPCRSVRVPNSVRTPFFQPGDVIGGLDHVGYNNGTLRVRGWAIDTAQQNTPAQIEWVITDRFGLEVGRAMTTANRSRADIRAILPGPTQPSGVVESLTYLGPADFLGVCATAIGASGSRLGLGCRAFADSPTGAVPRVRERNGLITISGWALASGSTDPAEVEIVLNGRLVRSVQARLPGRMPVNLRADHGGRHFYRVFLRPGPGTHTVCARAVDRPFRSLVRGLANTPLGCRQVTIS